jgi:hypothetical protein
VKAVVREAIEEVAPSMLPVAPTLMLPLFVDEPLRDEPTERDSDWLAVLEERSAARHRD